MRFPPLLLALPLLLTADETLRVEPAVALTFATEPGKFYQIQVQSGEDWKAVGPTVVGDGAEHTRFHPAGQYRIVQPSREWALVWADEFAGADLDMSKWGKVEDNYGGGNNERQAYRTDPKYCYIQNGHLRIAVHRDPHTTSDGKTQPYSSARIRTLKRGDWKFGKIELRAKMPSGEGIWPAVWMLPTESKYGTWASGGEIDILESRGSAVHETTGALHFGGPWPRNTFLAHAYTFPGKNAAEDFHVYGIEWNAEKISWSIDGKVWKTRTRDEWFTEADRDNPSAPFDQPFHLIINVAVDGRFFEKTKQRADKLPDDAFPQILEVDWVRVYQWAE